jgi:hypothetical protein
MDKVVQAVASRGFLLWMGRSGGAFLSRSPASSSSFATNLCARQGARANPARCFSAQPEDERGYIPLRNSMAKQLNLKPIEIPYPKMFRKRHKRMLQRLEFTRLEAAVRKKQTKEARERKMEKRREKWRAAMERKKDWENYLKSKQDSSIE